MRVVIQRVKETQVIINGQVHSSIMEGLCVFCAVHIEDKEDDVEWCADKISRLRIFSDDEGKMNNDIAQCGGSIMVISQFTLYALTKKGNRPSYILSAGPEKAIPLYELFVVHLENKLPGRIQTGVFGADMEVQLINDGPVTIILDSRNKE